MKNTKRLLMVILFMFLLVLILRININIMTLNNKIERLEKKDNNEIALFLGDSITQRYKLETYLPNYYTINSGVGGNTTNDILIDMDNRVNKYTFNKVFLLIGINDLLFTNNSDEEIINNINQIIDNIHNKNAKIYLESVYPINTSVAKNIPESSNDRINIFNNKLKVICDKKCTYVNIYKRLSDKKGSLKRMYTNDGIHINKIGYIIVTNEILKYIK